jgi:hypothetical protein
MNAAATYVACGFFYHKMEQHLVKKETLQLVKFMQTTATVTTQHRQA